MESIFGRNMYNQNNANYSLVSKCDTTGRPERLCIKVGRGQGDGDIGTRVWGLGTWGREGRDVGTSGMGRGTYGTRGRVGRGRGDVKCRGGKVGGKRDISFFVKLCYLTTSDTL